MQASITKPTASHVKRSPAEILKPPPPSDCSRLALPSATAPVRTDEGLEGGRPRLAGHFPSPSACRHAAQTYSPHSLLCEFQPRPVGQPVIERHPPEARLVVVGAAPGASEDPFPFVRLDRIAADGAGSGRHGLLRRLDSRVSLEDARERDHPALPRPFVELPAKPALLIGGPVCDPKRAPQLPLRFDHGECSPPRNGADDKFLDLRQSVILVVHATPEG